MMKHIRWKRVAAALLVIAALGTGVYFASTSCAFARECCCVNRFGTLCCAEKMGPCGFFVPGCFCTT